MANNNQNPGKDLSGFMDAQMQATQIANQRADILKQARLLENNAASNTALVAQASQMMLGQGQQGSLGQSTQNILGKYGMKPGTSKSSQVSQAPGGSTIVNNTTNNIQIAPPPAVRQGPNSDTEKVKAWMNGVLNKQAEQSNIRMRELDRRESFLSRSSEKIGSSLAKLSKSVVTSLDPRRMSRTFGDSLGSTLKMIGLYNLISNWDKVMNFLVNVEMGFKSVLSWMGFKVGGSNTKWSINSGIGGKIQSFGDYLDNSFGRLLGGKNGEGFLSSIGGVLKEGFDYLLLKLGNWAREGSAAIKDLGAPKIDPKDGMVGITKGLVEYLGNVFKAFLTGNAAAAKSSKSLSNYKGALSNQVYDRRSQKNLKDLTKTGGNLKGIHTFYAKESLKEDFAPVATNINGDIRGNFATGIHLRSGDVKDTKNSKGQVIKYGLENKASSITHQSYGVANMALASSGNSNKIYSFGIISGLHRLYNTKANTKDPWVPVGSGMYFLESLFPNTHVAVLTNLKKNSWIRENVTYYLVKRVPDLRALLLNMGLTDGQIAEAVANRYLESKVIGNFGAALLFPNRGFKEWAFGILGAEKASALEGITSAKSRENLEKKESNYTLVKNLNKGEKYEQIIKQTEIHVKGIDYINGVLMEKDWKTAGMAINQERFEKQWKSVVLKDPNREVSYDLKSTETKQMYDASQAVTPAVSAALEENKKREEEFWKKSYHLSGLGSFEGFSEGIKPTLNSKDRVIISKGEIKKGKAQFEKVYNLLSKALPDLEPHQIAGLMSHLYHESRFDPSSENPGKDKAQGIGQWLGKRKKQFQKLFGKEPKEATIEEQIDFIKWDLNNIHKRGYNELRNAANGEEAASAAFGYYGFSAGVNAGLAAMEKAPGHGTPQDILNNYKSRLALGEVIAGMVKSKGGSLHMEESIDRFNYRWEGQPKEKEEIPTTTSLASNSTTIPFQRVDINTKPADVITAPRDAVISRETSNIITPSLTKASKSMKQVNISEVSSIDVVTSLERINDNISQLREDYRIGTSLMNSSIVDSGSFVAQQVINSGSTTPPPAQTPEQPIITPSTNYIDTTINYS